MKKLGEMARLRYLVEVYGLRRGTATTCWTHPPIIDLSGLDAPPGCGGYPLDFSADDFAGLPTDAAGAPMVDYASLGRQYNPWFIGHIGLARFSRWRQTGSPSDLQSFRRIADWFLHNAVSQGVGVVWQYGFEWFGGHEAPWYSGLSQAHGISVLIRAGAVFSDESYDRLARQATCLMISPLDEGGAAVTWPDGTLSFEERTIPPPTSILNGHLFSTYAAWEAARFFQEPRYHQAAELGWRFVKNRLDQYDLGYWSRYSLRTCRFGSPDIASQHYHAVHAVLLRVAAAVTGDACFAAAADRLERYERIPRFRRRARIGKIWTKLLDR